MYRHKYSERVSPTTAADPSQGSPLTRLTSALLKSTSFLLYFETGFERTYADGACCVADDT
eukprot:SAG31_NODE_23107_length_511_cov_0.830097_1_plen_60_part_01